MEFSIALACVTTSDPLDNGVMLAFLAWAQKRELYARLGLTGPPLEAPPQITEQEIKGIQEVPTEGGSIGNVSCFPQRSLAKCAPRSTTLLAGTIKASPIRLGG
jgi:hypothetical protein